MLNFQAETIELFQENIELKGIISDLEEKLTIKESLTFKNNSYWIIKDGKEEGPFCPNCWDTKTLTVRLLPMPNPPYIKCPNCNILLQGDKYIGKG